MDRCLLTVILDLYLLMTAFWRFQPSQSIYTEEVKWFIPSRCDGLTTGVLIFFLFNHLCNPSSRMMQDSQYRQ